jgi:RNA polymerase sigma factor (sigma-70 family)
MSAPGSSPAPGPRPEVTRPDALAHLDLVHHGVRRYRRRYRSTVTGEDLFQEAAVAVLLALAAYDPPAHGPIDDYISRKVASRLRSYCRREARQAVREQPLDDAAGPDASDVRGEVLALASAVLPDEQREIVCLLIDGWTVAQIAELLGSPEGTIRWLKAEAFARLRAADE